MLTFAAPTAPAQARDFDFSGATRDQHLRGFEGGHGATLTPTLEADHFAHARYWPNELLDTFILKMAASGQCVNTAMMLGDRHYAMVQLATARVSRDAELMALSARLQAYFEADAPEACIVAAAIAHERDARFLVV